MNGSARIHAGGGSGGSGGSGGDPGGGGGGSGGALILQAGTVIVNGTLSAFGGAGGLAGDVSSAADGGVGGHGRVRIDGLLDTSTTFPGIPSGFLGSNFTGPALDTLNGTHISGRAIRNRQVEISVQNRGLTSWYNASVNSSGKFSVPVNFSSGNSYITVIMNSSSVLGSAGVGVLGLEKGVIPMNSGTPFYTIDQNPMGPLNLSCLAQMNRSATCTVTWLVNATGALGTTWEFFVIANSTDYFTYIPDNESPHLNITIAASVPPSVQEPETWNNLTFTQQDAFERNASVFVNVTVTDPDGDLTSVNLTLVDASGVTVLNNVSMKQGMAVVNGFLYNQSFLVNETAVFGLWNITVFGSDSSGNVRSRSSNFTVTDLTAPTAASISASPASIYQGQSMAFNVTWYDLGGLASYIFATNRTGSWENASGVAFGGNLNFSVNTSTFFEEAGTVVGWSFYANDTFGNTNSSTIQSFVVGGVRWNVTTFDLGSQVINGSVPSGSAAILGFLNNTNIQVACLQGDCSVIRHNFTNGTSVNGTSASVLFNCSTASEGNFSANFSVVSSQDALPHNISVSCRVGFLPNISLVSPADQFWTSDGDVLFVYNVTTPETMESCSLLLNDAVNQSNSSITTNTNLNFSLFNMGEGVYNWSVNCTTITGLASVSDLRTLYIDQTPPLVNISHPLGNTTINVSDVRFNWTAYDNMDPSLTCDLTLNGTVNATLESPNGSIINYTASGLDDGFFTWSVACVDNASLSDASETRNFTLRVPPRIASVAPANRTVSTSTAQNFSYIPYDNSGFVANCTIILNGLNNQTNSSVTAGVQNNFTVAGLGDGNYSWAVNCSDPSGNHALNETRLLTIDTTAPTVALNYPPEAAGLATSNISFNFTATDLLSANLTCNLTINNALNQSFISALSGAYTYVNVSGFITGAYNWSVTCWDWVYNTNSSETRNFTVGAPDLNITADRIWFNDTNPDYDRNITIYANISNDGVIPATSVLVRFYDGDPSAGGTQINGDVVVSSIPNATIATVNVTWPIPLGYHQVFVSVDPESDIVEASETNNIANVSITTLYANVTSPANGTLTPNATTQLNFTAADFLNSTLNWSVFVDGVMTGDNGTLLDENWTLLNLTFAEGVHFVQVQARDPSDRYKNSTRWYISVDLSAPNVTIVTANRTWFNTATPLIFFNISDTVDQNINFSFFVNGSIDTNGTAPNDVITNASLQEHVNGTWLLFIRARDDVGRETNSSPIVIYIDTEQPGVTLNDPANETQFNESTVMFNWTATDNLAPTLTCNLTISNHSPQTNFTVTSGVPFNVSVSGLSNGVHYWNVTCWDLAGNANTSETRWFNVTAPDLMVNAGNITLNSSAIRENDNVTINATIFNIDTGTATNILVQFWDGIPGVGSQMNGNITIPSLAFGQNVTVNVSHRFRIGTTQVYVIVDPSDAILESNEGNNNASRNITVSAFHTVVGNSSGQLIINDLENRSLFAWSLANISGSNIFAVSPNWTSRSTCRCSTIPSTSPGPQAISLCRPSTSPSTVVSSPSCRSSTALTPRISRQASSGTHPTPGQGSTTAARMSSSSRSPRARRRGCTASMTMSCTSPPG
ncbi:hypothetical protein J4439_06320 [Candidatus Woesearchaeota archaeon]|nr:hypothetical protein [Candidatus Woesearchaeota archaeon]